jgi:hypothetical protein
MIVYIYIYIFGKRKRKREEKAKNWRYCKYYEQFSSSVVIIIEHRKSEREGKVELLANANER